MEYKPDLYNESRHKVSIPTLVLQLFVGLAFTLHLFVYSFPSNSYIVLALILVCVYALVKPIIKSDVSTGFTLRWLIAILVIAYSYVFSYRSGTAIFDLLILLSGLIVVIAFSPDVRTYQGVIKYIKYIALFFAIGVLAQRFIPQFYNSVIRLFPSGLYKAITTSGTSGGGGYRGFTTNSGFAANYILVGILAVICENNLRGKWTIGSRIFIVFMIIAVLFTSKRGPILFFIIALIFCYLMPSRGAKKHNRIWGVFIGISAIIIMFFTFEDVLADIPIFREVINTINGISSGEDVTSGRTKLYAWAFQLFLNNPIRGIGWGYFRRTVVGEITIRTTLDVHNVYLQLLCETGIIGFVVFVSLFIWSWVTTKNAYCSCIAQNDKRVLRWRPALLFSFAFQTYFILYCLTGNPLYDQFYQIIYMFCCSITVAYRYVSMRTMC